MAFRAFEIDDSVSHTESGAVHVPEGEYLVTVASGRPTPENYDREWHGIHWRLKIVQGPGGIGRELPYFTTMKPGSQFGLGRLVQAAGASPDALRGTRFESYVQFKTWAEALIRAIAGRSLGALVADDLRNGRTFSSVQEVYPAGDYPERAKANAVGPKVLPDDLPAATTSYAAQVRSLFSSES